MVVTVLIIVSIVIVALLILITVLPSEFRIERTRQVHASSGLVYSVINDLHQWERWSPYVKFDPKMQKTYSGAPTGPGASYAWNGNNKVGEGRLTIVDSEPDRAVKMDLEFNRPFRCKNKVTFAIVPNGKETKVSWIMEGRNSAFGKLFSLLMNMDKMVGKQFEEGLENLDRIAAAEATGAT